MLVNDKARNAKFTKWNAIKWLDNKESIFTFLQDAFETPDDREYVYSAIATVVQAVNTYDLHLTSTEDETSLAEDAAAVKNGTPITREMPLTVLKDGGANDVRESA